MSEKDQARVSSLFSILGEDHVVAHIYLSILSGALSVENLIQILDHEFDTIAKAVARLLELPLITAQVNRMHQVEYYALPPKQAFHAIGTSIRWGTNEKLHAIEDIAKLTSLDDRASLQKKHSAIEELGEICQGAFRLNPTISIEMVTVTRTREESTSVLTEIFSLAQKEISAVAFHPHLFGAITWEAVSERMRNGVKYKRISTAYEVVRHGVEIFRREIEEFPNLEMHFIDPEDVAQKFYVVDENYIMFFNPGAKSGEFELGGQMIRNRDLALRHLAEFKRLADKAKPSQHVLEHFKRERSRVLSIAKDTLHDLEYSWYEKLVDYGVFAHFTDVPQNIRKRALEKAEASGLVTRADGGIFPNLEINV